MSAEKPFSRSFAFDAFYDIAEEMSEAHAVERIAWAGDLRLGLVSVRQLVIMLIERYDTKPNPGDLFGEPAKVNLADDVLSNMIRDGRLRKEIGPSGVYLAWGPQVKIATHVETGIPVHIYTATRENWFNAMVHLTGPQESNLRISLAAAERGLRWAPWTSGFETEDCSYRRRVTSERDVFDAVGLPYLEPASRIYNTAPK